MLPEYIQFTDCCQNICHILQNSHHCNVYISQTEEEMQESIKYIIFEYISSKGIIDDKNEDESLLLLTSSKLQTWLPGLPHETTIAQTVVDVPIHA